jgi:hypothetical protein
MRKDRVRIMMQQAAAGDERRPFHDRASGVHECHAISGLATSSKQSMGCH